MKSQQFKLSHYPVFLKKDEIGYGNIPFRNFNKNKTLRCQIQGYQTPSPLHSRFTKMIMFSSGSRDRLRKLIFYKMGARFLTR